MLSLKQTWRTTLCLDTILWYDQRATTPLHLRLLQRIKINLENSPALHPYNESSCSTHKFLHHPRSSGEIVNQSCICCRYCQLAAVAVGSWLWSRLDSSIQMFSSTGLFRVIFSSSINQFMFVVSPIKYLSIKVMPGHKMPWFDLPDFWEYPQKGQGRSEASWLFPTIYYCLLLYSNNSSSTGLIQTNQSENDNVFCLY